MHRFFTVFLLSVALTAPTSAQLYSCPKAGGGSSYTSAPTSKNCKRLDSHEKAPAAATGSPIIQKPLKKTEKSPSTRLRTTPSQKIVKPSTQKNRNNKRGEILLYELGQEQLLLDSINAVIAETPPDATNFLAHLTSQQRIHALNIAAIRQELARL